MINLQKYYLGLLIFTFSLNAQNLTAQKNNKLQKVMKIEKIDISMFPAAKPGFKRSIIQVPAQGDDMNFKIEFFVGKFMEVDCNTHNMMGKIEEKDLQGWGYTFYEVDSKGETASTLMACLDGKKTKQFISIPSILARYNSRLPIIIYHPENLEVQYRIWSADTNMKKATN